MGKPVGFMDLPGELRNDIYGWLVEWGALALMRTNSGIRMEMESLVDERATYRMYVNHTDPAGDRRGRPSRERVGRVQNVEIHWKLPYFDGDEHSEEKWSVAGSGLEASARRRRCAVYLERPPWRATWVRPWHAMAWAELSGFSTVEVRTVGNGELAEQMGRTLMDITLDACLRCFVEVLEQLWGRCEHGISEGGRVASFRPRAEGRNRCRETQLTYHGTPLKDSTAIGL
ncbi:hypothetical protein IMSHALPRED_001362 [Imshaugia aleurites]|uniref:Uncharacterized protein n=1 Tax=Imshaugia aleurites TaxID=172621 RepID=A0A8H3J2F4_9LECA|nr:hypothetical protein IMSHALPRED_001362 [Imshaugia aleurites]